MLQTRELMGDFVRAQSVSQYAKHYSESLEEKQEHTEGGKEYIAGVAARYKATRKFRKRENATFDGPSARAKGSFNASYQVAVCMLYHIAYIRFLLLTQFFSCIA